MMDMREMTPTQLIQVSEDAKAELLRRQSEVALLRDFDSVVQRNRAAGVLEDPVSGAAWDSSLVYGIGDVVEHKDKVWRSLTAPNSWEPGVSGWRAQRKDGKPAAYVQPSGAHDAYQRGEQVTEGGEAFESRIDGNVWPPSVYPEGWKHLDGDAGDDDPVEPRPPEEPEPVPDPDPGTDPDPGVDPEPEPQPDPGTDPEPEPGPDDPDGGGAVTVTDWQPDMDVVTGQYLAYEGRTYRVLQPHKTQAGWLPDQLPALYEVVNADAEDS